MVRRDGREPLNLAAAIGALVTERTREFPAAGASLRERWAATAPTSPGDGRRRRSGVDQRRRVGNEQIRARGGGAYLGG
ncbi:hypothetical protein GCM10010246_56780 [Streptomyces cuspidosporus]|uniref:Uncharacterized protein n=1 Tax=Streptomyces cuspidosporus TaxID=66882 RepID=A0ABP5TQS2_9ACTN